MTIWLVGNQGMLGTEVERLLVAQGIDCITSDRELDISDGEQVDAHVLRHRPSWIVNCAAYTAVDRAEQEPDAAMAVNATGPANLARAARHVGARLLHVSTDYVFDGTQAEPLAENDAVRPLGVYGRSKAAGEAAVTEDDARHVIVRTSWLHGPAGPNFVSTMLRLLGEREELGVVDDQRGRPTYAADLAQALLQLTSLDDTLSGIYHYANRGICTWCGFAREIQAQAIERGLLHRKALIRPISTAEYPTPARRPANSALDTHRIEEVLGVDLAPWQDALGRHLDRLLVGSGQP